MKGRKKPSESSRPRARQSRQPSAKIAPTITYSERSRLVRAETTSGQGRDRNSRQIETINEYAGGSAKRWMKLSGLILILIAILVGLSSSTNARIEIVQPTGFSYLPHSISEYHSAAASAIGSSIYNRFKLTISSADIAALLEEKFPEIAYVAVTEPLIGFTPTVHIQLSKPALIYAIDNANSYLVNSKGFIVEATTSVPASELKGLAQVNSVSGGSSDQVLSPEDVTFISTVKQALAIKGVLISKMDLVPMAEELDVYPVGVPYFIKFNLHQTDSLSQVGTYLATISALKQQNKTPSQYVDVRVDGRAYYK